MPPLAPPTNDPVVKFFKQSTTEQHKVFALENLNPKVKAWLINNGNSHQLMQGQTANSANRAHHVIGLLNAAPRSQSDGIYSNLDAQIRQDITQHLDDSMHEHLEHAHRQTDTQQSWMRPRPPAHSETDEHDDTEDDGYTSSSFEPT